MVEIDTAKLKGAVETQHGCTATVFQSVPIKETFGGKTVWEGVVYTFSLIGHPTATRAYAWSSPIEGSDKRGGSLRYCISGRLHRRRRPCEPPSWLSREPNDRL